MPSLGSLPCSPIVNTNRSFPSFLAHQVASYVPDAVVSDSNTPHSLSLQVGKKIQQCVLHVPS